MGADLRRETAWLTQNLVLSDPAAEFTRFVKHFVVCHRIYRANTCTFSIHFVSLHEEDQSQDSRIPDDSTEKWHNGGGTADLLCTVVRTTPYLAPQPQSRLFGCYNLAG